VYDHLNGEEMAEYEHSSDPAVQRLAAMVRRLSQSLLFQKMGELGRKYLGSGEAPGLDIALWKAVVEAPVRLSDEEAAELEQISQQAGGWWRLGQDPEFLDLEAWAFYYAEESKMAL
jgi:hypothetical protein